MLCPASPDIDEGSDKESSFVLVAVTTDKLANSVGVDSKVRAVSSVGDDKGRVATVVRKRSV